jgi:hypothetical protein
MNLLQRNDPKEDRADILLRDTSISDAAWSRALSRNRRVKEIKLDLYGAEGRNWDLLLRAISTRDILEKVTLSAGPDTPKLAVRFLQSIQLNPAIRTLSLWNVHVSGNVLADFLDTATSVTDLGIHGCEMKIAERGKGVIDLAASIQRSTWIRKLSLSYLLGFYLCAILDSLASNSHVRELVIGLMYFSEYG